MFWMHKIIVMKILSVIYTSSKVSGVRVQVSGNTNLKAEINENMRSIFATELQELETGHRRPDT